MEKTKLFSMFLLLLIVFSLVALINPIKGTIPDYSGSLVSQSIIQEMYGGQSSSYLNQTTRVQIFNFVTNNPGINFRGICNSHMLPIGVVQYQ